MNEINVSTVCAGYAFELVFKAVVASSTEESYRRERKESSAATRR